MRTSGSLTSLLSPWTNPRFSGLSLNESKKCNVTHPKSQTRLETSEWTGFVQRRRVDWQIDGWMNGSQRISEPTTGQCRAERPSTFFVLDENKNCWGVSCAISLITLPPVSATITSVFFHTHAFSSNGGSNGGCGCSGNNNNNYKWIQTIHRGLSHTPQLYVEEAAKLDNQRQHMTDLGWFQRSIRFDGPQWGK